LLAALEFAEGRGDDVEVSEMRQTLSPQHMLISSIYAAESLRE